MAQVILNIEQPEIIKSINYHLPLYTELPRDNYVEEITIDNLQSLNKSPHTSQFNLISSEGELSDRDPLTNQHHSNSSSYIKQHQIEHSLSTNNSISEIFNLQSSNNEKNISNKFRQNPYPLSSKLSNKSISKIFNQHSNESSSSIEIKSSYDNSSFNPSFCSRSSNNTNHITSCDSISNYINTSFDNPTLTNSNNLTLTSRNKRTSTNSNNITSSRNNTTSCDWRSDDINFSRDSSSSLNKKPCQCENCQKKILLMKNIGIIEAVGLDTQQSYVSEDGTIDNERFLICDSNVITAVTEVESLTPKESVILTMDDNLPKYEQCRIFEMIRLRHDLASKYLLDNVYLRPINFHGKYVGTYSKGLPHNKDGFVDVIEMEKLITALKERDWNKLAKIKMASKVKLVNPSAFWSQDIIGKNNNSYRYSPLPSLCSNDIAEQMVELYCMSLTRDIRFNQYYIDPIIAECCCHLNKSMKINRKVTPYNIFRGSMYGDLQGPYISQFLYRDIKIGGILYKQKYPIPVEVDDFMKSWESAIKSQDGIIEETLDQKIIERYLITGRDLANYTYQDDLFQVFYNTCSILFNIKVPMNPGITKISEINQAENYVIDFGKADVQASISIIGRNALLAAWYVKWNTLFLRPEAYGIEVERVYRDNRNKYGISRELLMNPIIEAIRSRNGTALLTQVFREGSPLSPSTPSGQATIAGACATVLKFFFDGNYEIDIYEPDTNGDNLIKTGKRTTVIDEINKLASNIAIGRNWAGVNYHMDVISGLKRGEKVAISCLQDMIYRYSINISVNICLFNEKIITIHN